VGRSARGQPVGAVSSDPSCIAGDETTRLGPHHQPSFDLLDPIETATTGITCNAISPGTLPTPAIQGKIASIAAHEGRSLGETTRDYLAARQPSARFIAMESIGAMVVFLASPAGHDITGATLPVDGGWAAA
jgi:NAD(P)-dependent dehydrogenase (short-subunit alcohol dehydrogenase family)